MGKIIRSVFMYNQLGLQIAAVGVMRKKVSSQNILWHLFTVADAGWRAKSLQYLLYYVILFSMCRYMRHRRGSAIRRTFCLHFSLARSNEEGTRVRLRGMLATFAVVAGLLVGGLGTVPAVAAPDPVSGVASVMGDGAKRTDWSKTVYNTDPNTFEVVAPGTVDAHFGLNFDMHDSNTAKAEALSVIGQPGTGIPLKSIDSTGFRTYVKAGDGPVDLLPSLQLELWVPTDAGLKYARAIAEPYRNVWETNRESNPNGYNVPVFDNWVTWDFTGGQWWLTRDFPGLPRQTGTTLESFVQQYPGTMVSRVGAGAGSYNAALKAKANQVQVDGAVFTYQHKWIAPKVSLSVDCSSSTGTLSFTNNDPDYTQAWNVHEISSSIPAKGDATLNAKGLSASPMKTSVFSFPVVAGKYYYASSYNDVVSARHPAPIC